MRRWRSNDDGPGTAAPCPNHAFEHGSPEILETMTIFFGHGRYHGQLPVRTNGQLVRTVWGGEEANFLVNAHVGSKTGSITAETASKSGKSDASNWQQSVYRAYPTLWDEGSADPCVYPHLVDDDFSLLGPQKTKSAEMRTHNKG